LPLRIAVPDTHHFDLGRRMAAFGTRRFDREDGVSGCRCTPWPACCTSTHLPSLDYSTFCATRLITRDQRQVDAAFQRCVFCRAVP
jgi:serine/threonine-protein kinase HipA